MRPHDLICFPDCEWHRIEAAADSEMRFLAFHVPGKFKTIWADPKAASAWRSAGRDIHGGETARDERERRIFAKAFGNPFTR